ncbi:MAG: GNAT family N-acetyltransferase [Candidatus Omnitrophica bacterium]|nr:GNAT family N-acetyltransferase [Candidatus Omnitrophota bacterium]
MQLKILKADKETCGKYYTIIREVFSLMDPARITRRIERFDASTRFYVVEEAGEIQSLMFLTDVVVGAKKLGGIGGVATRKPYRGKGYARALLKKILEDTTNEYPALLLWTRIPAFFKQAGFQDASGYFEEDKAGSLPMMCFHKPAATVFPQPFDKLPRVYF